MQKSVSFQKINKKLTLIICVSFLYWLNLTIIKNNYPMLECTRFKSIKSTKPVATVTIASILDEIKSDKYRDVILAIRQDENPSKSLLKDKLPCFTPTGVFNHRSIAGLENYNGLICLDIDHVDDAESLKTRASKLTYVHAAFITPSGNGLKVMIKTNASAESYKAKELEVSEAFAIDAGGIRDNRCKDLARIQFVSYDPNLYYNPTSRLF